MTDDIVKRLKRSIDEHAPVTVEDLRAAVAEIERLRDAPRFRVFRGSRMGWAVADRDRPAFASVKWDDEDARHLIPWVQLDNRPHGQHARVLTEQPAPDLEARLARLERSVRDNTRRLDLAYRALHDAPVLRPRRGCSP